MSLEPIKRLGAVADAKFDYRLDTNHKITQQLIRVTYTNGLETVFILPPEGITEKLLLTIRKCASEVVIDF